MKLGGWRRRDAELDEELRGHLRMAIRERVERGETPEQAEAAALREFGNVGLVKEVTRGMWGWAWLRHLTQDLKYGLRTMRRAPWFTARLARVLRLLSTDAPATDDTRRPLVGDGPGWHGR